MGHTFQGRIKTSKQADYPANTQASWRLVGNRTGLVTTLRSSRKLERTIDSSVLRALCLAMPCPPSLSCAHEIWKALCAPESSAR